MPVRPGDFSPSEVWIDDREKRELAMRKRFVRGAERWSAHTRDLLEDKTGFVIEDMGFNKYRVKVDGSG